MEFAIQTTGVYEDVLAAARFSEARGLPAIALPDHYLMALDEERAKTTPAPDALAQLAGLTGVRARGKQKASEEENSDEARHATSPS